MQICVDTYKSLKTIEDASSFLYKNIEHSEALDKALEFSINAHNGQFRKSKEPYVVHCIVVASLVAKITNDADMTIAALLHDVIEDTSYSKDEITDEFGLEIAKMVDSLTKIDDLKKQHYTCHEDDDYETKSKQEIFSALHLRKIFFQENNNEKVFVIKLCDRMHNLMTLDVFGEEKQKRIASESLVIYAPIAHRLGISVVKNIIEDLSFFYLNKIQYESISQYLQKQENHKKIKNFVDVLEENIISEIKDDTDIQISSRVKHIYSTHIKMQKEGIPVEEVLDLSAVRIIVKNRLDCYIILGIVHKYFKPIASKVKDYISLPKENGYQTLHTTVLSSYGVYEIQIRTQDMHKNAEYGIAAHWKYKSLNAKSPSLAWFNNLEYKDSEINEFKDLMLHDLYTETVEVFSPKHKVFSLPRGSTCLDFAYAVHSDIGDRAYEAYVNGVKVSLLQEIRSGDIVEISTKNDLMYHCSWIDMVQTSKAKKYIKTNCSKRLKLKNFKHASKIISSFFNINYQEALGFIDRYSINISSFLYNLDYFKNMILNISQELNIHPNMIDNIVSNFIYCSCMKIDEVIISPCCKPKLGDNIINFLSKDNQLIVHSKLCSEVKNILSNNDAKSIFLIWDRNNVFEYILEVSLNDSFAQLTSLLNFLKLNSCNITHLDVDESKYCVVKFYSRIDISNLKANLKASNFDIKTFKSLDVKEKLF